MLESVIAYILKRYLGEYFDNLLTDQLNFLLLSGCIEIEHLPIKPDSIKKFNLPINIKNGFVRKLKLKIPLHALKSQPWEISITGLNLLLEPAAVIDSAQVAIDEEICKQQKLKKLEEEWMNNQKGSSSSSWASQLIATVLENLQVCIEDVHIRYEDMSSTKKPFSIGIKVGKLAICSTDENWAPNFFSNQSNSWKLVELSQFSIYSDSVSHFGCSIKSFELPKLINELGNTDISKPYFGPGHEISSKSGYSVSRILEPLSCTCRMIRNKNPSSLKTKDGPRYMLHIDLSEVHFLIAEDKYKTIISTADAFNMFYRARAVRKWRPILPIHGNARIWWKFVIGVHRRRISEKLARTSPGYISLRIRDNSIYVKLYKLILTNSAKLSKENKATFDSIEKRLNYEELCLLRKAAMSQIEKENADAAENSNSSASYGYYLSSWIPNYWGTNQVPVEAESKSANNSNIGAHLEQNVLQTFSHTEFEEELNDLLDLDEQTANSFLFRDSQFAYITFNMKQAEVCFINEQYSPMGIIDAKFDQLKLAANIRPRIDGYQFNISLNSIQIIDRHHVESCFPVLVDIIPNKSTCNQSAQDKIFTLTIIKNRKCLNRGMLSIIGQSLPLKVICNAKIMLMLQEFFRLPYIPTGSNLEENLTHVLNEKLQTLKKYTASEIRPVIDEALDSARWWSSKHLHLELEISAPCFVLPENFFAKNSRAVIIDLGLFTLQTINKTSNKQKAIQKCTIDDTVSTNSQQSMSDNEDDYGTPVGSLTPCEHGIEDTMPSAVSDFSNTVTEHILNTMYDRYQLTVMNLQIMVTDSYNSDAWKLAYESTSTSSPIHFLDKLSISFHLCRRLKLTCDPSEANIAITGALPRLDLHIDEEKLNTISVIQAQYLELMTHPTQLQKPIPTKTNINAANVVSFTQKKQIVRENMPSNLSWFDDQSYWHQEKRKFIMDTKLFDAFFTFQEVTVSLSHRGKLLIQLRVPGINLTYVIRPYDYIQSISIQDLFVADALQKFGSEYELLISSIGKDDYSPRDGDLLPKNSNRSVLCKEDLWASFLQNNRTSLTTTPLLKLERNVVYSQSPKSTASFAVEQIKAVFTTLDIVANQETIVEIIAFFKSLRIINFDDSNKNKMNAFPITATLKDVEIIHTHDLCQREVFAVFECVTVTFVYQDSFNTLRKVGMMKGYGLNLTILTDDKNNVNVSGFLNGFSLLNEINDAKNDTVLHVGTDEKPSDSEIENAFLFNANYDALRDILSVDTRLASVHYTHSSEFQTNLFKCFSEFKYYFDRARDSLHSYAKDMAYSILQGDSTFSRNEPAEVVNQMVVRYNIFIRSPKVQIHSLTNPERMLKFNLGEITITNKSTDMHSSEMYHFEHIQIIIKDIFLVTSINEIPYKILEETDAKVDVIRRFHASNLPIKECEILQLLHVVDAKLLLQDLQILISINILSPIKVNINKICYESIKEILNSQKNIQVYAGAQTYGHDKTSDVLCKERELQQSILFWAGCNIVQITTTIFQEISNKDKSIVEFCIDNFEASICQEPHMLMTIKAKLGGVRGYDLLCESSDHIKPFLVTSYLDDYLDNQEAFHTFSTLPEVETCPSPLRNYKLSLDENPSSPSRHFSNQAVPERDTNLISSSIKIIPTQHPEFHTKYFSISNHVEASMNHLHMIVNLQTWVILLDFLGVTQISTEITSPNVPNEHKQNTSSSEVSEPLISDTTSFTKNEALSSIITSSFSPPLKIEEKLSKTSFNSLPSVNNQFTVHIDLSINSLIVVFNKEQYPLSCNTATNFKASIELVDGNARVVGELGKASIIDLSRHGTVYREKFVTGGDQALHFDFFKYGEQNYLNGLDYNINISFRMSSVRYLHTKRFFTENLLFCQHFFQLVSAFQRMKASSSGNLSFSGPSKHLMIKVDLSAASPVMFVPSHGTANYVFIGELGNLTISNEFKNDGEKGTWTAKHKNNDLYTHQVIPLIHGSEQQSDIKLKNFHYFPGPCQLDIMNLYLEGNDIFTAHYDTLLFKFIKEKSKILKEKLSWSIKFERNLHMAISHVIPNFRFEISISDSHCMLDKKQMEGFKAILSKNLGETLEDFEVPTSVIQDPIIFVDLEERWIEMSFLFVFHHVCLEFLSSRASHDDDADQSLSRFYMHNTTLRIDILSDLTKDVDFISRQLSIIDMRYDDYSESLKPSIYREILLPKNFDEIDPLSFQVEIHAKLTPRIIEYSIILNKLRMLLMMDLGLLCMKFIGESVDEYNYLFESNDFSHLAAEIQPELSHEKTRSSRDILVKVSVTETDLVVIEDLTSYETQALVCRGTLLLNFSNCGFFAFSCHMSGVELFSCCLASEEESSLSIIDPLNIVIDIPKYHTQPHSYPISIEIPSFNVRLSYTDIKLFYAIITSLSPILSNYNSTNKSSQISYHSNSNSVTDLDMDDKHNSHSAMLINKSNINYQNPPKFSKITFQIQEFMLCFIDDCGNCDTPLIEIIAEKVVLNHSLNEPYLTRIILILSSNFYNRNISDWEPFIEPFKFCIDLKKGAYNRKNRSEVTQSVNYYSCTLKGENTLLINLSDSLVLVLKNTLDSWRNDIDQSRNYLEPLGLPKATSESYSQTQKNDHSTQLSSFAVRSISSLNITKRNPFIPFRIENNIGMPLKFAALSLNPYKINAYSSYFANHGQNITNIPANIVWMDVPIAGSIGFEFEKKGKIRHQHLKAKMRHQLLISVEPWGEITTPVSVDQIGLIYRELKPTHNISIPGRIIFSIKLEGAQKVINVRTPLLVNNQLKFDMEVKLTYSGQPESVIKEYRIKNGCYFAIPIDCLDCDIYIRPRGWGSEYPSSPINLNPKAKHDLWKICIPIGYNSNSESNRSFIYTYTISGVEDHQRDSVQKFIDLDKYLKQIVLTHPFMLENLLPYETDVTVLDLKQTKVIKPGGTMPIISFTPARGFKFTIQMENFLESGVIEISPYHLEQPESKHVIMYDELNRQLRLSILISNHCNISKKIVIYVEYWFINKTNFPLLFCESEQDGYIAGQFGEHEKARSLTPLVYSPLKTDTMNPVCHLKLGTSPLICKGTPLWSEGFQLSCSRGGVLLLYVKRPDGAVPFEYQLSVDISKGKGKYNEISMIEVSCRFQFENYCALPISYIQVCQHTEDKSVYNKNPVDLDQNIHPNCTMPFICPYPDKECLLRVKYKSVEGLSFSGPFNILSEDTFILSMQSKHDYMYFVRVQIRTHNFSFIIRFTDTQNIPLPYIIENYSQIDIHFVQKLQKPSTFHRVKPGQCMQYAWDEILSTHELRFYVDDDSASNIYNPSEHGDKKKLLYDNYFNIALYDTFLNNSNINIKNLVLDIDISNPHCVIFAKRSQSLSQLWRLTGNNKIQHVMSNKNFVIDIGEKFTENMYSPLMLRESEDKRNDTQIWKFDVGLLILPNLPNAPCVCAKLQASNLKYYEAVLVTNPRYFHRQNRHHKLAENHHIEILKSKPGSGMLAVKIFARGPSNVVRITDNNPNFHHLNISYLNWNMSNQIYESNVKFWQDEEIILPATELNLESHLEKGVGLSIIEKQEEILYFSFEGVTIVFKRTNKSNIVKLTVKRIQVDNQAYDSTTTCVFALDESNHDYNNAFVISVEQLFERSPKYFLFKFLHVELKDYLLILDERIILRMIRFFNANKSKTDLTTPTHLNLTVLEQNDSFGKYYYFKDIFICSMNINTNVITLSNLPPDLQLIKDEYGLKFVQFEANIFVADYQRKHTFDKMEELINSIKDHYIKNLRGQALKVLGSVDFLGNPLGLFNDLTHGIHGLVTLQHGLTGFIRDVTHGLSDSACKIAGSAGNVTSYMSFDRQYQREREEMTTASSGHILTGLGSFATGVLGGVTSIFTSPYQGAQDSGMIGMMTGIGRGVAGTFAKPITGTLDLLSSTSKALRETTRNQLHPDRKRYPRCFIEYGEKLVLYSEENAIGYNFLKRTLSKENSRGTFIILESLYHNENGYILVLVSSIGLYFFDVTEINAELNQNNLKLMINLSKLKKVTNIPFQNIDSNNKISLKFKLKFEVSLQADEKNKCYEVPCYSKELAIKIAQIVEHAKHINEEEMYLLTSIGTSNDW